MKLLNDSPQTHRSERATSNGCSASKLLTEYFTDAGIVHVGARLQNGASFLASPDHECIHRPFDVLRTRSAASMPHAAATATSACCSRSGSAAAAVVVSSGRRNVRFSILPGRQPVSQRSTCLHVVEKSTCSAFNTPGATFEQPLSLGFRFYIQSDF